MFEIPLTDGEFQKLRVLLLRIAGIHLADHKKAMVRSRLGKRLRHHKLASYTDYHAMLIDPRGHAELETAIDLLTTNETSFFREPKHFEWLTGVYLPRIAPRRRLRIWSAGCSSGEEAYSIAMVLAEHWNLPWDILASDISARMLASARRGCYPMDKAKLIPSRLLYKYCLEGTGARAGLVRIGAELRRRVQIMPINLNLPLPEIGEFDLIFLRNVMIYFHRDVKKQVLGRVCRQLKPDGHLLVGHAESLHAITRALAPVAPAIHRKP